jgi:hypothetical protein
MDTRNDRICEAMRIMNYTHIEKMSKKEMKHNEIKHTSDKIHGKK